MKLPQMRYYIFFITILSFIFPDNSEINKDFDTAFSYYKDAKWDSAQFYFDEAILNNDSDLHPEITIAAYRNIGNSLIRLHKLQEAKQPLEQSIFYAKKYFGESNQYLVKAMNSLAVISSINGESHNAISYFEKIVQIQMNVDSTKYNLLGKLYNNIANNYNDLNNFDDSIKNYKRALLYKEITFGKGSPKLAVTYNNIGTIYHNMGNHDEAIDYFKFALQYKDDSYAPSSLAKIYKNMGLSLLKMNDLELAKSYTLKAIALEGVHKSYSHYNTLGNIYRWLNENDKAIDSFKKSLTIMDSLKIEDFPQYGNTMNYLGVSYLEKKDTTIAKGYFNKSINIHKKQSQTSHLIHLPYYNLAKCNLNDNPDKAREYANKTLSIADSLFSKNNAIKVDGYNMLATIAATHKNYIKSLEYYNLAIEENQGFTNIITEDSYLHILSRGSLLDTYMGQIEVNLSQKEVADDLQIKVFHLSRIIQTSQKALELIEYMRDRIKFSDSKYSLMEYSQKIINTTIEATYQLYDINSSEKLAVDFLKLVEKNHHVVLKSSLLDIRAHEFSEIPDSIIYEERQLRSELTSLENKILNSTEEIINEDSLTNKAIEYDDYIMMLEKTYPDYHYLKYKRPEFNIFPIINNLKENELILEFTSDSKFYYVIIISNVGINVVKLSEKIDLDSKIDLFLKSLKKVNKKPFVINGNEIYNEIFSPLSYYLDGKNKLFIIPDGKLSELPFDALVTEYPIKKRYNFSELKYLINDVEINYLISSTFFNNPPTQNKIRSFLGIAPVNEFSSDNNIQYNDLIQSEVEVLEIESRFKNKNFRAQTLIKNDATESQVKELANHQYDVIHFATHGILNKNEPKLSALLFHKTDELNDGILYSSKLFNLNLNAELVVLSSCESGSGEFQVGEGILSLMQGIFYAGAHNLIYTLWKVDDQITSEFMINFYDELLKTNDISAALHQSKLKMIKNPKTANPRTWSGYSLISK